MRFFLAKCIFLLVTPYVMSTNNTHTKAHPVAHTLGSNGTLVKQWRNDSANRSSTLFNGTTEGANSSIRLLNGTSQSANNSSLNVTRVPKSLLNGTREIVGSKRTYVNRWFDENAEFGKDLNDDRRSDVYRNLNNDNNGNNPTFGYPSAGRRVNANPLGNVQQDYQTLPTPYVSGNDGYNERVETSSRSYLPMIDQSHPPINRINYPAAQTTQLMNNFSPFLNYYKPIEEGNHMAAAGGMPTGIPGMGALSRRDRLNNYEQGNYLPPRDDDAQHQLDSLLDNYMYNIARGRAPERPSMEQPRSYPAPNMQQPALPTNQLMFPPYSPMMQMQDQTVVDGMDASSPQGEVQVGPRPLDSRFFQAPPGGEAPENELMNGIHRMNPETMYTSRRDEAELPMRPMEQIAPVPVSPMVRSFLNPMETEENGFGQEFPRTRELKTNIDKEFTKLPSDGQEFSFPRRRKSKTNIDKEFMNVPSDGQEFSFPRSRKSKTNIDKEFMNLPPDGQEYSFPRRREPKNNIDKDFMNLPPDGGQEFSIPRRNEGKSNIDKDLMNAAATDVESVVRSSPDVQSAMNSVLDSIESDELKYKKQYSNHIGGTRKNYVQRGFEGYDGGGGGYEGSYPHSEGGYPRSEGSYPRSEGSYPRSEGSYLRSGFRGNPFEDIMEAGDREVNELEQSYKQEFGGRPRVNDDYRRGITNGRYNGNDRFNDVYSDLSFGQPDHFAGPQADHFGYENDGNHDVENYEMIPDRSQAILGTVK